MNPYNMVHAYFYLCSTVCKTFSIESKRHFLENEVTTQDYDMTRSPPMNVQFLIGTVLFIEKI